MNSVSHSITIHNAPTTNFSFVQACAESPTQFTDLSQAPGGDTITQWAWDFGIAGSAHRYQQPAEPHIHVYYPRNLFGEPYHKNRTWLPQTKTCRCRYGTVPRHTSAMWPAPCENGTVQFQDSSWSYQATITNWNWQFEPFQFGTGPNPSHTYYAIDSCYSVQLAITDIRGCVDTILQQVCVPPAFVSILYLPAGMFR